MHSRTRDALLLVCLVLACGQAQAPFATRKTVASAAPRSSATQPSAPVPAIQITVVEAPGTERWTVEYRFAHPVMGVSFERPKERLRDGRWAASADGGARPIEWAHSGDHELLRVKGTAPCSTITLTLPTDSAGTKGDYEQSADKPVMVRLADRKTPVPVTCRPEAHPPPFKRLLRAL